MARRAQGGWYGSPNRSCSDALEFFLNNTKITDDDLTHVGKLADLNVLGLANTQVTDRGLAYLLRVS